jgi:hypothetical protein
MPEVIKTREMYDERGDDGKRKYTVTHIGETFGVSGKTVYRHLAPDAQTITPTLTSKAVNYRSSPLLCRPL